MHPFLESVIGQFGEEATGSAAEALGLSRESVGAALATALPAMLSAIAGKAAQPDGAAGLMRTFNTLTSMGSSQPSSMLRGLLNDPRAMNAGANMARSLLGPDFGRVVDDVVSQAGLSEASAVQVLGLAAPAVLGVVGTQARHSGIDAAGLGGFVSGLMQPEAPAQPASPAASEAAPPAAPAGDPSDNPDDAGGITDAVKRGLKKLFGRA